MTINKEKSFGDDAMTAFLDRAVTVIRSDTPRCIIDPDTPSRDAIASLGKFLLLRRCIKLVDDLGGIHAMVKSMVDLFTRDRSFIENVVCVKKFENRLLTRLSDVHDRQTTARPGGYLLYNYVIGRRFSDGRLSSEWVVRRDRRAPRRSSF